MFDLKINLYIVLYNKMAGKNSKQSKKTEQTATPSVAQPVAVQTAPVQTAPVQPAPVQATPASSQKGGKKGGKTAKAVEPVAVVAPVVAPAVVAEQSASSQKGGKGKKAKATKAEAETVAQVATIVETAPTKAKKGGKATAKKETKVAKAKTEEVKEAKEGEEDGEKHVRSFKVKLPNAETYEGRFTGLTPYQAANKALSKYFRESKNTDDEVTFSICESTRNSKKNVYTYNGRRHKLEVPVTYKIQDGREIVKNFKNTLKKIKKTELNASSA